MTASDVRMRADLDREWEEVKAFLVRSGEAAAIEFLRPLAAARDSGDPAAILGALPRAEAMIVCRLVYLALGEAVARLRAGDAEATT